MVKAIISFVAGIVFAVGLVISGMTNPDIVIGFLDIFGNWNPALIFVMAGAVSLNLLSFKFLKEKKPLCEAKKFLPTNKIVDKKLVIGGLMFGIGWGVLGVCPGPGIVNIVTLDSSALLFVASMMVGMVFFKLSKLHWDAK